MQNTLLLVAGGTDSKVAKSLDRNISGALWMPDGHSLLACADDGPHAHAWLL